MAITHITKQVYLEARLTWRMFSSRQVIHGNFQPITTFLVSKKGWYDWHGILHVARRLQAATPAKRMGTASVHILRGADIMEAIS